MTADPGSKDPGTAVTVAEMRALERYATEVVGLPGIVLMENAGAGAARHIDAHWPAAIAGSADEIWVLTGPGNNGGDGWVVARHLALAQRRVRVLAAVSPERLRGDAAVMARAALGSSVTYEVVLASERWLELAVSAPARCLVVVDALLGTGSGGPARAPVVEAIEAFEGLRTGRGPGPAVVALDVPSGLDADTGARPGAVLDADVTLTFGRSKLGLFHAGAAVGELVVVPLGIPLVKSGEA